MINLEKNIDFSTDNKDLLWNEFDELNSGDHHLQGIAKEVLSEEDCRMINEFLEVMKDRDYDGFKADLDSFWVHLMRYDEELNRKVVESRETQKNVQAYLLDEIKNCQDEEIRKIVSSLNVLAIIRTKLVIEYLKRKKLNK